MSSELENMKKLAAVKVLQVTEYLHKAAPLHLVVEVRYQITAENGDVMYQETVTADVSKKPDIEKKTLAERWVLALDLAKQHAKSKYGKKA